MTTAHSAELQAYAERTPIFPGDSTINQFFEKEKYEAYRRLGFENGRAVISARQGLIDALGAAGTLAALQTLAEESENFAVTEVARLLGTDAEFDQLKAGLLSNP